MSLEDRFIYQRGLTKERDRSFSNAIASIPGWPQGLNRFSYVSNNPVNDTDPTGHMETGACGQNGEQCSHSTSPISPPPGAGNDDDPIHRHSGNGNGGGFVAPQTSDYSGSDVGDSSSSYPGYEEIAEKVRITAVDSNTHYGIHYQDTLHRVPSIQNAQTHLEWTPVVGLRDALKKTLDYHLKKPALPLNNQEAA